MALMTDNLKAAHDAVLADLRELDRLAGTGPCPSSAVLARLTAARADLRKQFAFEEEDGYMRAVMERAPNRERAIEVLRAEHRELAEALDSMVQAAALVVAAEEALRGEVKSLINQVQKHEAAENALVQDVFSLDIGTED